MASDKGMLQIICTAILAILRRGMSKWKYRWSNWCVKIHWGCWITL